MPQPSSDVPTVSTMAKPVRVRPNITVTVPAGQELELRGEVIGRVVEGDSLRVLPRSEDFLPEGLQVVSVNINCLPAHRELRIVVRNGQKRDVRLDSSVILAELEASHGEGRTDESPILQALVGPSCESSVTVNSVPTTCLLDSGSQVTVISESFYRTHLAHLPLNSLQTELQITGAGGQNVPFLGYIHVTVMLPEDTIGVTDSVRTMAVICPDTQYSSNVPVIIGTNTFRLFAMRCEKVAGEHFATTLPVRSEIAFSYLNLPKNAEGRLGSVKLRGRTVTIPAGGSREVKGCSNATIPTTRSFVLVQEPVLEKLPEGVNVVSGRIPSSNTRRTKVTLCNFTDHDVVLRKNQVIADLFLICSEYAIDNVVSTLSMVGCEVDTECPLDSSGFPHSQSPSRDDEATQSFKFGPSTPPEWQQHFSERLQNFRDVFIKSEFDVGELKISEMADGFHDIELQPGAPVRERPRPLPPLEFEEVRQHIQELLDAKIITPSTSPFASPIVLVRKKSGALRMCVDYRKVNARTVRDSYAIPKIEDLFLTLSGSQYYTSVDLSKAYYQVPLTERAKKISAFTTPFGLYQFERLSFGLVNAPMTFQRLMERVFGDMNLVELIVFLDDILIHGKTLAQLEERTIRVLERLRRYGLKLDPEKCVFGVTEVKHLGYVISAEGVRPDPEKLETLTNWPIPKTVKEVKSFLGFAGFYRRFVPNFALLAKPLNELTAGYVPSKARHRKKQGHHLTLASDISHLWGNKHQKAFDSLIEALTSEPVIGIADRTKPFQLHCDASGMGLGAVLYQEQEGQLRVIAYASRGLTKTEANYPAHKREFLALKWAMTDKFHDYLLGSKVTVVTDNNPLCYILKNAKLDATSHRWLAALSLYDFELRYKRGTTHVDADTLSRLPQGPLEEDSEYMKAMEKAAFLMDKAKEFELAGQIVTVNQDSVRAVLHARGAVITPSAISAFCFPRWVSHKKKRADYSKSEGVGGQDCVLFPVAEQLARDASLIDDDILEPPEVLPYSVTREEWRRFQLADSTLAIVIQQIEQGKTLNLRDLGLDTAELKVYVSQQDKLVMRQGVLYRRGVVNGQTLFQLVIPASHREEAMKGVHDNLCHTHLENSIRQARLRYFWPYMARDLEQKIKDCSRCIRKGAPAQKAPMSTIVTTYPLELLSIDFLTVQLKGQKQNVLVVMDHFTKFAGAFCTRDQTAKTVAKTLWSEFFMVYGFPSRILSDQGRDFESDLVKELCSMAGIEKCRTTPYHPCGNPVERWNRTLIGMLRSLEEEQKEDWKKHLKAVVHAYNSCIHQSTGFSPYYLFFGRHPRLPIDVAFGIELTSDRKRSARQYIQDLKQQLREAYQRASEQMAKTAQRNKVRYDASAHAAELEVGDRVLVRALGPKVESKVADRWERDIFIVIAKADGVPVYTVQSESKRGPKRTLHRNLLRPVGALEAVEPSGKKSQTGGKQKQNFLPKIQGEMLGEVTDEEDSVDIEVVVTPLTPFSRLGSRVGIRSPTQGVNVIDSSDMGVAHQNFGMGEDEEVPEVNKGTETQEPRIVLRRSTRQKRPVNRLNLSHVVQNRRV